jgi:HEPN domain-containing protein
LLDEVFEFTEAEEAFEELEKKEKKEVVMKCSQKSEFSKKSGQEKVSTGNKKTEDVSKLAKKVMKARKNKDYDLGQVADYAVEYLSEEYPEVQKEIKKCEQAEEDEAALTGATFIATAGTMASAAVLGAGASSMMGGMAS